jgi:hypothetical protein
MEKLRGILAILVVAAMIYVAWNIVPPYWYRYQFQDDLDEMARRLSYNYANKSTDDIKDMVIKKAASDNVTLKEDEVTVTMNGAEVGLAVKYHVHVDLMVRPVDLDFALVSYNKRI